MEEAAVHLVQRLLSLRETRVPGRRNHHVEDLRHRIPAERSSAASDVVPHSPQTLVLSSTSTTSLGSKAPAAYRTWCLTPRKPLFFRPQAPRLSGQRRRRRTGRGASLPTNPYSFVRKHHVPRSGWADAGTDVVLHSPQSLVPSFPLHQVFGLFRSFNPSDLVQRLPQNLISPFPLHQVFGLFRSFNPSDLVQRLPQNLIPPFPLHQVFGPFRSTNPLGLVQRLPQNLVLSFPLHQVFGPFRSFNPLDLVQRFLQNLVLSFLLHHVPSPRWPAAFTDVVLHSPQSLIPSSRGTTSSPPDGIGKGSADEFAIRLHFLPLLFCIDRKSSGAIAPLLFLHNPIKFYYFTFPLLFGAV